MMPWINIRGDHVSCDGTPYHLTSCWSDVQLYTETRHLAIVRSDTEARSKGDACVWMADHVTVGAMHVCRMMLRSSRPLVCRGQPEPGHHVTNLSLGHCFQHLLKVKSEYPR
ncbi:hypothetical protein TNCV_1147351 [Trichonephila clavipes]|nr:hypothetical protein TNCV_1147351 [Trichonephila clavipes]